MKTILALGLAAAVATGAVTAVSSSASANPPGPPPGPPPWMLHHHHSHPYWWGGAPFFFGFGVGPGYDEPYSNYAYNNPHVTWCMQHYRTYNPATNTFFIRPGVPVQCVAPFDDRY